MALSRADVLSIKPTFEAVELPAGAGTICVRNMTAGERDRFEARQVRDPHTDFRARVIVLGTCDTDGKPLFTEADIPALNELPGEVAEPIVDAVLRVNKLRPNDLEAAEKKSETTDV